LGNRRAANDMTIAQAFDLALQRHREGRLAEAEALYRQILAVQPSHADALHLLGVTAHQSGRHDIAVDWIRKAIALNPNNPVPHSNLGEACRAMGRFDEAIAAYRRAIELKPDYPEAHYNLGIALAARGQLEEAIVAFGRALQLKPDLPEALYNLGDALRRRGRLDEAVAAFRCAIELKFAYPEAHCNLGSVLAGQRRFDEAIAACHSALHFKPDYPEALNNLGVALAGQDQLEDAVSAFRRALELKPDYPDGHNNLGNAFKELGELDESIAAFRHSLELDPERAWVHSNLIYALHFHPGYDCKMVDAERHRWNRQFGAPQRQYASSKAGVRSAERPLRIGYVSPDFRDHVVGRNLIPLFRRHDRRNFEVFCYAGVAQPDELTQEFRQHARQWRTTVGVDDESLAEWIRQDGVDILVDLTQHMAANRLPVFARKPAPVQVSFAGYPDSTGLEAIEYRISDRHLDPGSFAGRGERNEKVCLIDSFWCYDPCGIEVEVNGPPARESGNVTFGCLNNCSKINERVLGLWAQVLRRVNDSRLVLLSRFESSRRRILQALERTGVDSRRVEFVDFRPRREYLELYHRLDIVLDTFPYNGHTTSLDALWMGAPVVSLAGNTPVSRAGLSQLTNLGFPELVARSEEDYVKIAVELAGDLSRVTELRSTLRDRMKASVLMDAERFTRQIEQTYRNIMNACGQKQ
jgi:protein O-GlcNAc transferase